MVPRIVGKDFIDTLERVDEVFAAHASKKGEQWREQHWKEHLRHAIIHLTNALLDAEEGTECEAAHGLTRANMAMKFILDDPSVLRKSCAQQIAESKAVKEPVQGRDGPFHPDERRPFGAQSLANEYT